MLAFDAVDLQSSPIEELRI